MKNKIKILAIILLIILILGYSAIKLYAYFTDYQVIEGKVSLEFDFASSELYQNVDDKGIHVYVENTGNDECFVRVKIYSTTNISCEDNGNWYQEDGYWYYNKVLKIGQLTEELLINDPTKNVNNIDEINVTIIQEITEVLYDESGNAYPDWNKTIK